MLAVTAALVAVVALVQRYAPRVAAGTFDADPGVRALGLAFLIVGWMLYVSARLSATGTRRLLGRAAAIACFLAGAVRVAGPAVVSDSDELFRSAMRLGARTFFAACVLLAAAGYVFVSCPARKAARKTR